MINKIPPIRLGLTTKNCLMLAAMPLLIGLSESCYAKEWVIKTTPTQYIPSAISINLGDNVTWINNDWVLHEISFSVNPLNLNKEKYRRTIARGKSTKIRFDHVGRYEYICRWHGMRGVIEVFAQTGQTGQP
ncbi:MAG: plastocyanin/azurin family copper-binding protein [Gammaproteobacteria bacterium]